MSTFIKRRFSSIVGFTAFALLLGGSSAFAGTDDKIHSGNMCQPRYGSQAESFSTSASRIRNISTTDRWVTCPIVRDNTTNSGGTYAVRVKVERNTITSNPLACTLYSFDTVGNTKDSDSDDTLDNYATLYLDVDYSVSKGHYSMYCRLPRSSSVISYEVKEFD